MPLLALVTHPTCLVIGASFQRLEAISTWLPLARLYRCPVFASSPATLATMDPQLYGFLHLLIFLLALDVRRRLWGRRGTGHFRVLDRLFLTFLAHVTTRPRNSRTFVVSGMHPTVTRECTVADVAQHRQDLMLGHAGDNSCVWLWLGTF